MSQIPCYPLLVNTPGVSILKSPITFPSFFDADWQQAVDDESSFDEIFEQAYHLPERARSMFLDERCKGQPDLRRRIETLLEGRDATPPEEFLDPQAILRFMLDAMDDATD